MKIFYSIIFFSIFTAACEPANDCLRSFGELSTITLKAAPFSAIEINGRFNVMIQEGKVQQVTLSTGNNLITEIDFEVIDSTFIINNNLACHWARSYDFPTLTIIHPDIREIRQGGSGSIKSIGVLHYPQLYLFSRDQSGDFELEVDCNRLTISNNDVSNFYISGLSDYLKIGFYSGDGRFQGENLEVKVADVYHRGSNDIIVHVTGQLTGWMRSTGNLIYVKSQPPLIDVRIENTGQLINRTE